MRIFSLEIFVDDFYPIIIWLDYGMVYSSNQFGQWNWNVQYLFWINQHIL